MKSCPNHGPIDFAVSGILCPACGEELTYWPDAFDLLPRDPPYPTTTTLRKMFSRPTIIRDPVEREKIERFIDSHIAGLSARRDQSLSGKEVREGHEQRVHELTLLINQALDFRAAFLGTRESRQ